MIAPDVEIVIGFNFRNPFKLSKRDEFMKAL
jgi:hypothetical protein